MGSGTANLEGQLAVPSQSQVHFRCFLARRRYLSLLGKLASPRAQRSSDTTSLTLAKPTMQSTPPGVHWYLPGSPMSPALRPPMEPIGSSGAPPRSEHAAIDWHTLQGVCS